jgi:glycosyltransferase involved in cell wall biosynthesis
MRKKSQIKLVFCIPDMVIGGVETVFVNTVDSLLKSGFYISIVTHRKIQEPLYLRWLDGLDNVDLYTEFPLMDFFENIAKYCKCFPCKQIRKMLFSVYKNYRRFLLRLSGKLQNADLVIDYKNFQFFKDLRYVKTTKVAWLHTAPSYFEKDNSFSRLPIYDHIVAITDEFVEYFKNRYPQYSDKIVRIYNPIDVKKIQKLSEEYCPPSEKYFCHVSRLCAGKDIKTLLDAFNIFASFVPDIKLYIVGDGDMGDSFKKYASALSCNKRVVFTGKVSNPYPIMRGALANILSSEFEGLPTTLIESQVLQKLTISSNCKTGPIEILENGSSGLLFDIGDAKKLAEHMLYVVKNPKKTDFIIENANRSLNRFDKDNIMKQIIKMITKFVK